MKPPKRIKTLLYFVLVTVFLTLSISSALAYTIDRYSVDVLLTKDSTLNVTEEIQCNFHDEQKHGIYRNIPIKFSRNHGTFSNDFKLLDVTDENDQPLHYSKSMHGNDVFIKIGDADKLITGLHTYKLHYLVRRAINVFNNEPEVYWNVTGNEWPCVIKNVTCRFFAPKDIKVDSLRAKCFIGTQGSTKQEEVIKEPGYLMFTYPELGSGEGMTFVVRLPANSLEMPSAAQEAFWFMKDWWPAFTFPTFAFILMFSLWWHLGRDQMPVGGIAVDWEPPKELSPAEVGTLLDEKCDMPDIVSTLVDLAARGYIQIKELPYEGFLFFSKKDYEFTKLKDPDKDLSEHEKTFMYGLFGSSDALVYLSQLKNKFYFYLPGITNAVYDTLISKNCFVQNPEHTRQSYVYIGAILFFLGLVALAAGFVGSVDSVPMGIGVVVSGVIIFAFARIMPARTKKGVLLLRQALAYQRFVRMAEKDRIKVLVKDDPTIFGRLLPYAMVLGVADIWAEKFHDLLAEPPNWYVPYGYGNPGYIFSSNNFVNDLGSGMNTMGSAFASQPSSSSSGAGGGFSGFDGGFGGGFGGGGFSGGGFGGGGGGSW